MATGQNARSLPLKTAGIQVQAGDQAEDQHCHGGESRKGRRAPPGSRRFENKPGANLPKTEGPKAMPTIICIVTRGIIPLPWSGVAILPEQRQ